jgi:hypothetical protein
LSGDHLRVLGPGHPYTLNVHKLLCELLEWTEPGDPALRLTVVAVALADVGRQRFGDTRNRAGWREMYGDLVAVALRLASRQDRRGLLVEVMELARSQGLPGPSESDGTDAWTDQGGRNDAPFDDLNVEIPVVPGARVAVAGRSSFAAIDGAVRRLGDSAPGLAVGSPQTVELMAWAQELTSHAGPWVWGWWDVDGTHVWYVARQSGSGDEVEVLHGHAGTQGDGPESSALGAYAAAMQREDESLETFVARSDLTCSLASERELFVRLGRELIPLPIRLEVLRRLEGDHPPLPLVVLPSSECSRVPFAALAVGGPDQATSMIPTADGSLDPRRLVEGALLYLAPGVQFTATVRERLGERWRRPVAVTTSTAQAVVASQPGLSDCLPAAGLSVPAGAERVAFDEAPSLAALVNYLQGVVAGSDGVFQFSGHAVAGSSEAPGAAHLLLHGGRDDPRQRLYASDLLTGRFPGLGLPRCVVLSACSTWGDEGAADWLGLAPGLMWNGAQHVVATLWPVLDSPDSAAHHRDLVSALVDAGHRSPVEVVRELQLAELARQRQTRPPHVRYRVRPEDLHGFASGFDWASYAVVTAGAVPV